MEYKQLLGDTIVPSNIPDDKKAIIYGKIKDYLDKDIPKKLYRYRTCSERNLNALLKDELWFSNGGVVNDAFDSRLYYNESVFREWFQSVKSKKTASKVIEIIKGIDELAHGILSTIPNVEKVIDFYKKIPINNFYQIYESALNKVADNEEKEMEYIMNVVQSESTFTCFSEKIDSNMMWGQYADSMKGFALEYDFGKNTVHKFENNNVTGQLFKVIYDKERLDTTDFVIYLFKYRMLAYMLQVNPYFSRHIISGLLPIPDEFMATKLSLNKSVEWEYEKEWRMFYTDKRGKNKKFFHVNIKPSAIYLGQKIDSFNEKAIVALAEEKKLPVYKMKINHNSRKYGIDKIKI